MQSKWIFCLVLLGQHLYGMSNESLFAQSTGGGGPGGGGNPPPVACTCYIFVNKSCAGFSLPNSWPGGPTDPPTLNCAIGIPALGLYYNCTSSANCPAVPFAYHQVSQSEWNLLRTVPKSQGDNPPVYHNGQWGWWGELARPAEAFVCQWRSDCQACVYDFGSTSGKCKQRSVSTRTMPQASTCLPTTPGPCWIPAY